MHDLPTADPTLSAFLTEASIPEAQGKTVVLASGGSSRWYFLEHGDARAGYSERDRFTDYGQRGLQRIVEQASMMLDDGISTVFAPGFAGGQGQRNPEYVENLKWAYQLLVDEHAQDLYKRHDIGALFRGGWPTLFEQLDAPSLMEKFTRVERETASQSGRWLVWFIQDELIPKPLTPYVISHLEETGTLPDRQILAERYYGRPIDTVDIFISNNKLSVQGMVPPLLTLTDLYFTVSPSFYMGKLQWRRILYDHIYARRRHYRDYTALSESAVEEMKAFYQAHEGTTMGIGVYHSESQTWRPEPWVFDA